MSEMEGQITWQDLDSVFGRMCEEHIQATKERISKKSSRNSSVSQNQTLPLCLCLHGGGGASQDASTMKWEDGALLGDYTPQSFGEYPREDIESHLSQILVDSPLPKFYLSEKACIGIINRSQRKANGKELPDLLKKALEQQIVRSRGKSAPGNL